MFGQCTDIGGECIPIGVRPDKILIVCHIIPDKEMIGNPTPSREIFHEIPIGIIGKRTRKIAFDGTKADEDVVSRTNKFRRFTRILVGKRFHKNVGKLLFNIGCNLIEKTDEGTGVRAFFFIDLTAGFAGAEHKAIVLADVNDCRFRIGT